MVACVGLLMWATHISRVLRPYIAPLYKLLNSPPGSNVSPSRLACGLPFCIVSTPAQLCAERSRGCICRSNPASLKSAVSRCTAKADLPSMPKFAGPTWVRLSDPTCLQTKVTNAAQNSLHWLLPLIQAIPTTSLSLPPVLSCLARADAAEEDKVGIGGWITTKHILAWFAEEYNMREVRQFWPFLSKDAHRYIACFETLPSSWPSPCQPERDLPLRISAYASRQKARTCLRKQASRSFSLPVGRAQPFSACLHPGHPVMQSSCRYHHM